MPNERGWMILWCHQLVTACWLFSQLEAWLPYQRWMNTPIHECVHEAQIALINRS